MLRNFSWLVKDEIAGMARPVSLVGAFEGLKKYRIDAIVSLTVTPLTQSLVSEFGFAYIHLPVRDFSVPTFDQIELFVEFADRLRAEGKAIVVHCDSGFGRTGTVLSVYLVNFKGYTAGGAVTEVRHVRPGSVETAEQEDFVSRFEIRKI